MAHGRVVFDKKFYRIAFTPSYLRHRWTARVRIFMEKYFPLLQDKLVLTKVKVFPESILELAHDRDYISFVKKMSLTGGGFLDYGDTPAYKGVFEDALLAVSGTLTLADQVYKEELTGFNPQGGFHHARRKSAGGFCVFNDVALSARYLRKKDVRKIAVIDIDAHHGDGTQEILYKDDILKISLHGYGYGFYPGTGWIDELGEGRGLCFNVNVPVPLGSGDDIFAMVLKNLIEPLIESYNPEVVIVQNGADGHVGDPLVGLRFTDNSYAQFGEFLSRLHSDNKKLLILGGGGYLPDETARIWALVLSKIVGVREKILSAREKRTSSSQKTVSLVKDRLVFLKEKLEKCGML